MTRKTAQDFHPEVLRRPQLAWQRTVAFFNQHLRT